MPMWAWIVIACVVAYPFIGALFYRANNYLIDEVGYEPWPDDWGNQRATPDELVLYATMWILPLVMWTCAGVGRAISCGWRRIPNVSSPNPLKWVAGIK